MFKMQKKTQTLKNFANWKAICRKCCEYKENHREELRQKERERYEQYKGQKLEKQKEKVECPICKIDISRNKMLRHERTQRHKPKKTKEKWWRNDRNRTPRNHRLLNATFPSYPDG